MEKTLLIKICRPWGRLSAFDDKVINWGNLAETAVKEGLGGFLYSAIRSEKIPVEPLQGLKNSYYAHVRNNLSSFNSLKVILEYLRHEGIETIVFRGASLLGDVYPSFGLRGFKDIDILLREDDFFRTIGLLNREGFSYSPSYISVLYNRDICIDLHTDLMTYSRTKPVGLVIKTDIDDLFKRTLEKEVQGCRFLVLHPEDALLSLAVHLQMHSFERLIGFLDIAMLIDVHKKEIDWDRLFERAKVMNIKRTLYYSLFLMPEEWRRYDNYVLRGLEPHRFHHGEKMILNSIKEGKFIPYSGETLFLLNVKGLINKLRFLKGTFFPDEEVKTGLLFKPVSLIAFLIGRLKRILVLLFDLTFKNNKSRGL